MVRHARVSWDPRDDPFDPFDNVEEREPKTMPIPKRKKRKPRAKRQADSERDETRRFDPDRESE